MVFFEPKLVNRSQIGSLDSGVSCFPSHFASLRAILLPARTILYLVKMISTGSPVVLDRRGASIVSIYNFCSISNSSLWRIYQGRAVVNCIQISIFVLSATAHRCLSIFACKLWIAFKLVSLFYQQQHQCKRFVLCRSTHQTNLTIWNSKQSTLKSLYPTLSTSFCAPYTEGNWLHDYPKKQDCLGEEGNPALF